MNEELADFYQSHLHKMQNPTATHPGGSGKHWVSPLSCNCNDPPSSNRINGLMPWQLATADCHD